MNLLAYVSLLPYYYLGFLIVVLGAVALLTPATKRHRMSGWLLVAGAVYSVAFFLMFVYPAPFIGVERTLTASAHWAIYTDDDGHERISLHDRDSGGGWEVESSALSAHLREKMPPLVTVKCAGTYDYGSLRATGFPTTVDGFGVSFAPTRNAPRSNGPILQSKGFPSE
jgi:hypothetical protein